MSASTTHVLPNIVSHPNMEDADFWYEFEITYKDHVRGSRVGIHHECAAARALQSQPDITDAWVTKDRTIIIFKDGRVVRFLNPTALARTVRHFDRSGGVFPEGKYRIGPIPRSAKMGERLKRKNASKNAPKRNLPGRTRRHAHSFR